jgi:hypothetical protein
VPFNEVRQPGPKEELDNIPHGVQNWKAREDKHKR